MARTRLFAGRFDTMVSSFPGVVLATYHYVSKGRRELVGSLSFSAALTLLLTGITGPLEFMFLSVVPWLYVAHAFLDGVSFAIADLLSVRVSNMLPDGFIDFMLFNILQGNARAYWLYVVVADVFWFALCHFPSRFLITKFNVAVPGRENNDDEVNVETKGTIAESVMRMLAVLGGKESIEDCDACIIRLRAAMRDTSKVGKKAIKTEGAVAASEVKGGIQAVFGAKADLIKDRINDILGDD